MTTTQRTAVLTPPVVRVGVRPGLITGIACGAQFLAVLDISIVNLALPAMRAGLGLSPGQQQWVVTSYLLTFGGLLLLAARLGDLLGRRAVWQGGLVLFTAGCLAGGLAVNVPMLLAARAVQGIGAAVLAPSSLSLITAALHDARKRAVAIAWWGAASSGGGAAGVVLGGIITAVLGWRWVLLVSVPAGAVLWMAVARALLPGRQPDGVPRLDLAGALLGTLGAAALIFGVAHASPAGWAQPQVIVALCCSMVLIAGFVMVEARTPVPLVRLGVFRAPGLRTGLLVLSCLGATLTPGIFLISLYIQQELGCSAVNAGLALLPMGIVLCLGAPVARRLTAAGMTFLPVVGALITSAGFIMLARLPLHPQVLVSLSLPSLILAAGFVTLTVPIVMMVAAEVPRHEAGLVSGLINVSYYVAGAIGVSVLTTIAATHVNSHHLSAFGAGALAGIHRAMLTCAIIDFVAALAAAMLVSGPGRRARQMAGAVEVLGLHRGERL